MQIYVVNAVAVYKGLFLPRDSHFINPHIHPSIHPPIHTESIVFASQVSDDEGEPHTPEMTARVHEFPDPKEPVNFRHAKSLRLPSSTRGTPEEWTAVASSATMLVAGGYSVAVALGEDPESDRSGPDEAAEKLLTTRERSMYAGWRKKNDVPRVNWKRMRERITGSPSHRKRWEVFAASLSVLYREKVSPENAKAWGDKYPEQMPLLVAVRKIETARRDGRAIKNSRGARRDFHEIMACRRVMAAVGLQRVKSNTEAKANNRTTGEKEVELVRRIAKLDKMRPVDQDMAKQRFEAKELAWKKLTKARTNRVVETAAVRRQNVELTSLETVLRGRIRVLERRLEREAGGSSRGSR